MFGIGWGNLETNDVVQWFISFAAQHDKPIMLAESAAIKTSGVRDPQWVIPNTLWLENVFNLCSRHEVVKAFTYINVDWEEDNASSTWGDTQIQSAPSPVIVYWLSRIKSFVHADADLYSLIKF